MSRWRTTRRAPRRLVAGRYDLRSEQGRDAQGILWRGLDTLLRRDVVVKEITAGDDLAPEEREAFDRRVLREARAVARIAHPSVATLFDVIQEDERTFIVTEWTKARTLADVVSSDGPLPVERVAALGHQLVAALQAAHRRGIVHRRIGPAAILLLPDGRVRLGDFGIALDADAEPADERFAAPPEVAGVDAGAEADVWSLGATLVYAVEGRPGTDLESHPLELAGDLEPALRSLLAGSPHRRPALGVIEEQLLELGRGIVPEPEAAATAEREEEEPAEPVAVEPPEPIAPPPAPLPQRPRRLQATEEPADLRFQLVPPERVDEEPDAETGAQPRFVLRAAGTLTGEMPRIAVDPGATDTPEQLPRAGGAVSLGRSMAPPPPPPPSPPATRKPPAPEPEDSGEATAKAPAPPKAPPAGRVPQRNFGQPPSAPPKPPVRTGNGVTPPRPAVYPPGHPLHPGSRQAAEPPQALPAPPAIPGLPDERAPDLPTVEPGGKPPRQGRTLVLLASIAFGVALAVIVIIAFLQFGQDEEQPPSSLSGQQGSSQRTSAPTTVESLRGVTPPNWQPFIDPQFGWRIAVPLTWTPVQDRGGRVSFRDPASGAFVRVERAEGPLKPLAREAERAERTYQGRDGYQRLKLQSTVYKGVEAVEWEFRYLDGGTQMHAADLHLLIDDTDYVISYQAPETSWGSARPILERIRNSFEAG